MGIIISGRGPVAFVREICVAERTAYLGKKNSSIRSYI